MQMMTPHDSNMMFGGAIAGDATAMLDNLVFKPVKENTVVVLKHQCYMCMTANGDPKK